MERMLLRDVGDGLNLLINNNKYHYLTVDFGGDENIDCYCCFRDSFLLTHFHSDHYNGILKCSHLHCGWDLDFFYHPAMPSFTESIYFFMCLLTMNIRISRHHPLQNTILDLVKRINRKPVNFRPVSKGDIIVCGNRKYEILWPPKVLTDEEVLTDIRRAVSDFEEAKKSDRRLEEIYHNIYNKYSERDINSVDIIEHSEPIPYEFEGELSEIVKKANKSLRKAANRLSISFRQDDNILFLGDLEKHEIECVVSDLVHNHNICYDILIAAHHGTHWDSSITSIKAEICLASIGQTLRKHMKYEYKSISNKLVRTDEWGDIRITKRNRVK